MIPGPRISNLHWVLNTLLFFPFLFFSLFLIEVYLIYNIVLVSGIQHGDSVIHIYMYI